MLRYVRSCGPHPRAAGGRVKSRSGGSWQLGLSFGVQPTQHNRCAKFDTFASAFGNRPFLAPSWARAIDTDCDSTGNHSAMASHISVHIKHGVSHTGLVGRNSQQPIVSATGGRSQAIPQDGSREANRSRVGRNCPHSNRKGVRLWVNRRPTTGPSIQGGVQNARPSFRNFCTSAQYWEPMPTCVHYVSAPWLRPLSSLIAYSVLPSAFESCIRVLRGH